MTTAAVARGTGMRDRGKMAFPTGRAGSMRRLRACCVTVFALACAAAGAQAEPLATTGFTMKSATGSEYRIFVAAPPVPEPGLRLRVVYMLDGNRMFPLAVASAEADGTTDMVLVGIGYPTEDRAEIVRRR